MLSDERIRELAGHTYAALDSVPFGDADAELAVLREALRTVEREATEGLRAIIEPLNRLREPEGHSVCIPCANPDFDGPAQTSAWTANGVMVGKRRCLRATIWLSAWPPPRLPVLAPRE